MERSKGGNIEVDSDGAFSGGQGFNLFQKFCDRKIFVDSDVQRAIFVRRGLDDIFEVLGTRQ